LYFCTSDPHRGGIANWMPHRPDSFGNKPAGEDYPGVKPVHYDPAKVIVPPFLPDTPTCRAEIAQYYQSISRADAGLGRLVEILKKAGKYDDTLIIYVSDNGMPFPGAKTSAYEASLKLPCVVRNPENKKHGVVSEAMISWVDIAPTVLDFAGVAPSPNRSPQGGGGRAQVPQERRGRRQIAMHGRSLLPILQEAKPSGWDEVYASHTFHEVTMYYPMRVVRSGDFKLIWNIAHPLEFPFASDLFGSPTWQDSLARGEEFMYGKRTLKALTHRPQFELYDLAADPDEIHNLANDPQHQDKLGELKKKLRKFQKRTKDPWILKWERE
jgi:N-sulfoglucosamine sulfohydrolase